MPSLTTIAILCVAGLVLYAVVATMIAVQKQAGRDAEIADRAKRDEAVARKSAAEARKSEEVRHETDRGDFGDAVDKL